MGICLYRHIAPSIYSSSMIRQFNFVVLGMMRHRLRVIGLMCLPASLCPTDKERVVVSNAGVWSPGPKDGEGNWLRWDMGLARQWLD